MIRTPTLPLWLREQLMLPGCRRILTTRPGRNVQYIYDGKPMSHGFMPEREDQNILQPSDEHITAVT